MSHLNTSPMTTYLDNAPARQVLRCIALFQRGKKSRAGQQSRPGNSSRKSSALLPLGFQPVAAKRDSKLQRQKNHVGVSALPTGKFAHPESFCACLQNWPQVIDKSLERFRTVWKVFRQSGKFPESLESFTRKKLLSSS